MAKPAIAEIYAGATPLRDKVSYGADGVDETVLAKAEAVIAGLRDEFLAWADREMQLMHRRYADAAARPQAERTGPMGLICDMVQGISGQGDNFGFPLLTDIADSLGRVLDARAEFGPDEMAVVGAHIDALRLVIDGRLTDDGGAAGETMRRGLEHARERIGGG